MKKKSFRGKLVKLFVENFIQNMSFEFVDDNWHIQLEDKLKETFAFKCELVKFDCIDSLISGEIAIEQEETDKWTTISFRMVPCTNCTSNTIFI